MIIWIAAAQMRDTYGGTYRFVSSMSGELKRHGHIVKVFWHRREGRRAHMLFAASLLVRLLVSFLHRPHWIIAGSSDGLLCALVSRMGLVRTRVALHSYGWEKKVSNIERRLPRSIVIHPTSWEARMVRFMLLRATLAASHLCLCGTIEEARYVARRYPRYKARIKVAANGIYRSPRPFWPSQNEWPPSFLIIGPFSWKKNVEYGIDLFCRIQVRFPDARLFCVGTGPAPASRQRLLARLGDSVFIVERELPGKMFRWYETCPFLISTSRYEGGRSLAILEAQNKGMVVFASAIPSTMEFLYNGKNGILLKGYDIETDANHIISVCSDPVACSTIGTAAWRSSSRYSWERQSARLIKMLSAAK